MSSIISRSLNQIMGYSVKSSQSSALWHKGHRTPAPIPLIGNNKVVKIEDVAQLIRLTNPMALPEEKYVVDMQKTPLTTYSKFYNNQFNSSNSKEIVFRIITDINGRLSSNFLKDEKLDHYKKALQKIREDGINLLNPSSSVATSKQDRFSFTNPSNVYAFVLDYVETMHELLKSQESSKQTTYYTDFAKDFIKNLCLPGDNTQLFFTFKDLDEQYFIDVRPLCLYPVYLTSLPEFTDEKPVMAKGYVESKLLDFREVTYHDIGHAHIMSRQDKWLFKTSNSTPRELVTEWLRNKDWYMHELNKLTATNHPLYEAVKLYLFDIVHDRGYQFYLPILKQQFKALKNLENLKARILRGEFDNSCDRSVVDHLDEARKWLLAVTDQFIVKDNLDKIDNYKTNGCVIKKYPDVQSHTGVPIHATVCKNGKILVTFASNGTTKTTSLYEIELISLPVADVILNDEKIHNINKWMNILQNASDEFIQLDSDANILNVANDASDKGTEKSSEYHLKKIEIYKLERLLNLIKNKKPVKFSVSGLPDTYDADDVIVNKEKGTATIDVGLIFKLNEISVEAKPRTNLKYINLEPQDRFISEKHLRDSYVKDPTSKNPKMRPFVKLNDEFELGIVDTKNHVKVAKAVSSLLSRSIDRAKDIYGGYLPSPIVERAQLKYVSPYAVSNLWGKSAQRFVLSRKIDNTMREIIGTALVTNSEDTLLFFTNKYNNLNFSTIKEDVDFDLSADGKHKWFDKFDMPELQDYKPQGYHQLANFAIESTNCRGLGLGKLLIEEIVKNYALNYSKANIEHSQPLIQGKGLFQIADPSWRKYMSDIGFKLRYGAETFYKDQEWDKLSPLTLNGEEIDHRSYNSMYGLPQIYENINLDVKSTNMDLKERISKVVELANSGSAKLQYFQMLYPFNAEEETDSSSFEKSLRNLSNEEDIQFANLPYC